MPTTPQGYPYPASTDTPDVPRDVAALAQAVDDRLGSAARGTVSATIPIGATVSPGVAVTYPVGRFPGATAPVVVASANAGASGAWATTGTATASGCLVYLQARATISGNAFTATVSWAASQD